MTDATALQHSLPHAVFLRRLSGAPSATSPEARLGQGALLTLRLLDLLTEPQPPHPDAFQYQRAATERFCRALPPDATETAHLVGLVSGAADAVHANDVRLVLPALLAYAHHLEDELRLDEALDVLETTVRIGGDRIRPSDAIAVRLRMARALRKLNEFDRADWCYAQAGALAAAAGDRHSELVSRLGGAYTLLGRGNLREAEGRLRELLRHAEALRYRPLQAQTEQAIGVALSTAGQPTEAIPHAWRAFELYEDELSRTRVLSDLGIMLLTVGDPEGAERALLEVVRRGSFRDVVQNVLIELMHCASYRRDRVGFERWRERCEAESQAMPPNIRADLYLKMGIGRARFGQFDRAESVLDTALRIAEDAGLHELVFRVERIKAGLRDCQHELAPSSAAAAELVGQTEAVRAVSTSLARLAAQGG